MTDPSSPTPAPSFPLIPAVAGVVAAAVGPAIWVGVFQGLGGNIWLSAAFIGLVIGLAIRFTSRGGDRRLSWLAAVLTLASCFAGYMLTGLYVMQWTQPITAGYVARMFLNDIFALIVIAAGCYLAYILAARSGV